MFKKLSCSLLTVMLMISLLFANEKRFDFSTQDSKIKQITLTDIDGFKLGHAQNEKGGTGCTVIIAENGASAGVAVRGGAPGTRETDLLDPMEMVQQIHAVVLAGGSAYGLDASSGVMQYLESKGIGFDVGVAKVPIVCSAVLFDLTFGDPKIRPDLKMGMEACKNAETYKDQFQGNIGAGFGATVGKLMGNDYAMKGGLGTYAIQIGDLKIGAVVAVNCLGDVIDPNTQEIIAGVYDRKNAHFLQSERLFVDQIKSKKDLFKGNTTIGAVVTNAKLDKAQANKIASMTHNAYGRTMYPAHTMYDGDTIFTMASNQVECDLTVLGLLSTYVMERAVINAVENAKSLNGFPSAKEIRK